MSMQDYRENGILSASRQLLSTDIEESVLYDRTDDRHVEMSLCFIDFQDPLFCIGIYTPEDLPHGDPTDSVTFTVDEARLLRDLLNRPTVASILDETKEHRIKRLPGFTLAEIEQLQKQLDEEAQS